MIRKLKYTAVRLLSALALVTGLGFGVLVAGAAAIVGGLLLAAIVIAARIDAKTVDGTARAEPDPSGATGAQAQPG